MGTERYDHEVELQAAKASLGDQLADLYAIYSISAYLISDPVKVRSDLMNRTFSDSYQYLKDYLLSRADAYTEKLRTGDPAPEFLLVNTLDALISLSHFKGKVVYLSFWFPGCKGCIREFPFENALVKEFEGEPVQIISICTRASKNKWIAAVEKYELNTLNLYANELWQKRLEEKYGVNVYPHHVLIDADGRILENYTIRASEGVKEKIQEAIKAATR